MAEVANLPSQAPPPPPAPASSEPSAASIVAPVAGSAALPADIPNENLKNEVNDLSPATQLGTSPNQEKSSNSHHHDSEYDTASDLEGGTHEDYEDDDDNDEEGDEEEDDDDDSVEEVGNSDSDSNDFDAERQRAEGQEPADYTKKVDEDRSNPQYIPKKGTFYEHDDRTADEPEAPQILVIETTEVGVENKAASPTTISQASKTMKKWQPASGIDRWTHDRFVPGEQVPKTRSELVSAYGYDIRDEDGPPRARRRRRYARGPSKYSRNWEDETAYIKASNAQRKPPRPEDFPALEERQKNRKSRSYRDEKENRFDRQQPERNRAPPADGERQQMPNREHKEPIRRSGGGNGKHNRTGGRQQAMEFKNKNRSNNNSGHMNSNRGSNNMSRDGINITRSIINNQAVEASAQVESSNFQKTSSNPNNKGMNMQQTVKVNNQQPYNGYEQQQSGQAMHKSQQQQINNASASGYNPREINEKFTNNHSNQSNRPVTTPSSNLSARLQQAQNRNDPSHVGSVQMHTLANQLSPQVPNQNAMQNNMVDIQQHQQQQQQQQQQQLQQVQQEHSRTKRYSSLRQRSQHDTAGAVPNNPHLDQHTLQQLQMQHEAQQQQQQQQQQHQQIAPNVHPPQQLIMQEQQLMQANLMQLYHQENLQAQMQALQVSSLPPAAAPQPPAAPKQPYSSIPQQYAAGTSGPPPAAYYTPSTPDYSSPPPPAVPPPQPQYTPQPPAFLQSQSAVAPLAFNPTATQQPLSQNAMAPPIAASAPTQVPSGSVSYVQSPPPNPSAAPSAAYPNYTNFTPNFNTVGGTTYFVPTPQPTARPPILPQRRPTNAIPILPPSEKKRTADNKQEEDSKTNSSNSSVSTTGNPQIGSVENIDHILDNMFVQRAPYQPQTRKSASPPSDDTNKGSNTVTTSAGIADSSSSVAAKSRTHEPSSANASLLDNEPTSTGPDVNTQNMVVMGPVINNSESGAGIGDAAESIGKQSAAMPPQ